jgi:hypothetical protein
MEEKYLPYIQQRVNTRNMQRAQKSTKEQIIQLINEQMDWKVLRRKTTNG